MDVPFTVTADIDLGDRVAPYLVVDLADVVVHAGDLPERLGVRGPLGAAYDLEDRRLLLRPPNGLRILVEDGTRIVYERDDRHSDREVALFVLGTAWGALCWQRGLVALHASAVLANGRAHAFTGASGAGKSTLAAALTRRGRPLFADDTLIVDPAADRPLCYAGQKDLKLWRKALALTGCEAERPVRDVAGFDKHFARPQRRADKSVAPLATLSVLQADSGAGAGMVEPLSGAAAVIAVLRAMYRPALGAAFMGRPALLRAATALAGQIEVRTFTRRIDALAFDADVAMIDRRIGDAG